MATNFLKFCTSSADGLASVVGASCVKCAAGLGRMCTWSGEGAADSGLFVDLGSGMRIQFCEKWFKIRLLGLFFLSTTFLSQQRVTPHFQGVLLTTVNLQKNCVYHIMRLIHE